MTEIKPSFCRICMAHCQILVHVEDGRAVRVSGDPESELFKGYICPKGRDLPAQHYGPERLLHSLARAKNGELVPIGAEQAMDEIAAKVGAIVDQFGPRTIALYGGTGQISSFVSGSVAFSFLTGLGSPMHFTPITIDQPGKHIANAAHGRWCAGELAWDDADTWILVGTNPVVSKIGGVPSDNPMRRLIKAVRRGMQLIVIDPRETATARQAQIHLQARPGEDPTILAGLIHVIITEGLHDQLFIDEEVDGFEDLAAAVAPFTPGYVAERAGIPVAQLIDAARTYAHARSGAVTCGTGPNMSRRGNLSEYLALSLMSICGRWPRAGDRVTKPNVLAPAYQAKAQARPPYVGWDYNTKMRVRDLAASAAGMPTAALADEILLEGEGQVKALLVLAGNPMVAWPDQTKTFAALKELELLVCLDCRVSATAELADYVIAPKLSLETPASSILGEINKHMGYGLGFRRPHACYTPAIVDPPSDSDLLEEWEFFYGLGRRLGLSLFAATLFGWDRHWEAAPAFAMLDMENKPTTEELYEILSSTSRIPLSEVKKYPHGHVFDVLDTVQPKDPGFEGKLCVGNPMMLKELAAVLAEVFGGSQADATFPFRLVCRRSSSVMNSIGREVGTAKAGKSYNPAYLHPDDLAELGLAHGDTVKITSPHDSIRGIVEADRSLRRGVVSMTHCFGGNPDEDDTRVRDIGSSTSRLVPVDAEYDPITGIPRMSDIPVRLEPVVSE